MVVLRFLPLLLLTVFASCGPAPRKVAAPDATVTFSRENAVKNTFLGHGVQWSAYPHADAPDAEWGPLMTNEKWAEVYRRLDYLNPHVIRVMDVATWRYYDGLDRNNQPILNFDRPEMRSLYKLLDYCQKNDLTVLFGEWGAPGMWNLDKPANRIIETDDERWAGMIVAYLDHLILDKGYTCIKYYNLVNEPNGSWSSTDGDYAEWKRGYEHLAAAFATAGLDKYVSMSGPDAVPQPKFDHHKGMDGREWTRKNMAELDAITGMYDIHIYADQHETRTGELGEFLRSMGDAAAKLNKPIILGEIGMKYADELYEENKRRGLADPTAGPDDSNMFVYDYFYGIDIADAYVQSMNAGISGALAWDLDDAMHTVGDLGGRDQLKKWGMWNILGEELTGDATELTPRPWSYVMTLLCNAFPPGTEIIRPDLSVPLDSVRVTAGNGTAGQSFALINQSVQPVTLELKPDFAISGTLYRYDYVDGARVLNEHGFPTADQGKMLSGDQLTLTVPALSAVFLSTVELK